jgi:hypothetical protein
MLRNDRKMIWRNTRRAAAAAGPVPLAAAAAPYHYHPSAFVSVTVAPVPQAVPVLPLTLSRSFLPNLMSQPEAAITSQPTLPVAYWHTWTVGARCHRSDRRTAAVPGAAGA